MPVNLNIQLPRDNLLRFEAIARLILISFTSELLGNHRKIKCSGLSTPSNLRRNLPFGNNSVNQVHKSYKKQQRFFSSLTDTQLETSRDLILARLADLRSAACDDEVPKINKASDNHYRPLCKQEQNASDHLDIFIPQVHLRRVEVTVKDKYVERLRQKYRETIFHPGLLRKVRSRKFIISSPSYRIIDFSIPKEEKRKKRVIVKRATSEASPVKRLPILHPKLDDTSYRPIQNAHDRANKPYTRIDLDQVIRWIWSLNHHSSYQHDRQLENIPQNCLIRFVRSGQLVNYKYHDYDD